MKELLKQYVDTGNELSEYQLDKIKNHRNLLITYLRKRAIAIQNKYGDWIYYEMKLIHQGIKNNHFIDDLLIELVKSNSIIVGFINNLSEKVQLAAVQKDANAIQYIISKGIRPSEQVQLASVQQNGLSIEFIENPSEPVQLAAVQEDSSSIKYIKNPSEQVQLDAVQKNGDVIIHIKNPSEKVQLAAVQENSIAILQLYKKGITPSEQVQLASVKKNKYIYMYIRDPYPNVIEYMNSL
jgi:hypothetical protein